MPKSMTLISMALLAAGLAGCKEEEQPRIAELRPVRTMVAAAAPMADDRRSVGEIAPRHEINLGFRVSGKLVTRQFSAGDSVRRGNVLARLDAQDFQNKADTSKADVAAAEAVLAEARANEARQKKLLAAGVTTRAKYDSAHKDLISAEAAVEAAKIAVAMASDQLSYAELKAEADGVVTAIGAEPGMVVSTGQMVVTLAPGGERDAVFAIAESMLQDRYFEEGAEVAVSLLSMPAVTAMGVVREVSPIADPATRTYQVKVALRDPPDHMRFGASVSGRLTSNTAAVVVLPGSALFDKGGKPAVWTYQADTQSVALKPVEIARYETDRVIVASGLAAGDIVVTAGVNQLREGQKVRLLEGDKP